MSVTDSRLRSTEVETLPGGSSEAKATFGSDLEITVPEMCAEMAAAELIEAQRHALLVEHGYRMARSEEHTSELQSLMRISYAVFCLKKKKINSIRHTSKRQYSLLTHS